MFSFKEVARLDMRTHGSGWQDGIKVVNTKHSKVGKSECTCKIFKFNIALLKWG
ncbi:hypothetical protein Hanom_Chr07g00609071 [Helianthus anomalus]